MADKPLSQLVTDWHDTWTQMDKYMARLPDIIGSTAVEVCKDNFRLQAYDDGNSRKRWPKREAATNKRYNRRSGVKGSVYNAANKILEQTGNLRDGIGYKKKGTGEVFIGVDETLLPYAQIHNEGLKGLAFGKNPFTMPQRQFMPLASEGANPKMIKKFSDKVTKDIARLMNKFKDFK